jgi:hypothetical protein
MNMIKNSRTSGLDAKLEARFEALKEMSISSHENKKILDKMPMMAAGP